jgi:hypothetical protein
MPPHGRILFTLIERMGIKMAGKRNLQLNMDYEEGYRPVILTKI